MHLTRRAGLQGLATTAASLAVPSFVQAQQREIVVGAPNALTGDLSELGSRGLWGMQLAVSEINRTGGIASLRGARLKLVAADTGSNDPAQAAAVTRRLIDQEAPVALLGAGAGTMTLAAQAEAEKSEIPLITNAFADGIVNRGFRYTFKIAPQGGAVWNWALSSTVELWTAVRGRPPRSAMLIMGNDAIGTLLLKALPEHARTLGMTMPATLSFPTGRPDPAALVPAAQRARADLICLGGFANDVIAIVKALRAAGVTTPMIGAGLAGTDAIGKELGAAADRFFTPMAWNWDLNVAGNAAVVAAYRAAHPDQPNPPANEQLGQGYVTAMILRQALEIAASRDPKKLRDVLADAEFTALPYPNPTVRFGSQGLNAYNSLVLAEWIKGELRTVWPRQHQTVPPVI